MSVRIVSFASTFRLLLVSPPSRRISDLSDEFGGIILMIKLFENRVFTTMNKLAVSIEDIKGGRFE